MITLLIYDIPSDRLRPKVADACLDYGLSRIEFSAFRGALNRNRRQELLQRIQRILGKAEATIHLFVICERDLELAREVVQRANPDGKSAARDGE